MINRRELMTGAAALGAYGALGEDAEAVNRILLLSGNGRLIPPSGFGWTPPFNLFKNRNVYSTDFNINSYIPPIAKTYYVNSVTGTFGNPGTSALPLIGVYQAFQKPDVDQVIIQLAGPVAANGAYIYWGGYGWQGQIPTDRPMSIIPDAGGRVIMVPTGGFGPPTWTKTSGLTNTYQTNVSGGTNLQNGPVDLKYLDGNGDLLIVGNKQTSTANVDATPNSYYYDGSAILYVQANDSRNLVGDVYMTNAYPGTNGTFTSSTASTVLWLKNIDFVGGLQSFALNQSAKPIGNPPNFYALNCTFQASGFVEALYVGGYYNVFLQNCRATNSWSDGFGWHAQNGSLGPNGFECNCSTGFCGRGNSGSDQASSQHDGAHCITLNPSYTGSANQTINDILAAQRWILGGEIKAPAETDSNGNTLQIGASVYFWVDGTKVDAAGTFTLAVNSTGSVLHWRNTTPPLTQCTIVGPGTLVSY